MLPASNVSVLANQNADYKTAVLESQISWDLQSRLLLNLVFIYFQPIKASYHTALDTFPFI